MDLKLILLLCVLLFNVNCQYDVQQVINQTQYLQHLEKYGASVANLIFPGLINSTTSTNNPNPNLNSTSGWQDTRNSIGSRGSFNDSTGGHYESFNSTERFLNKTISSMSKGVCVKEVP